MSAAKHTPAPWWVTESGIRDSGGYICFTNAATRYEGQDERYARETAERAANKLLIAAAPELLAELRRLVANAEQSAFEDWLAETRPSGAVEEVQHQWQGSHACAEFVAEWGEAKDAIAKAIGGAA